MRAEEEDKTDDLITPGAYELSSGYTDKYIVAHSMEGLSFVMDWNWDTTFSVSRFHTFTSPSKLPVAR